MAARYRGRVSFLAVYVKEAHPEDGWVLSENRAEDIAVVDPVGDAEREAVAGSCAVALRLNMPMAIDAVDNAVARVYGGWPDRLYLVGADGRVAYRGGEGPFGFKPEELEAAIERELAGPSTGS
jgi:Iodothyronine deiodinase